jgi:hypothetical protein
VSGQAAAVLLLPDRWLLINHAAFSNLKLSSMQSGAADG